MRVFRATIQAMARRRQPTGPPEIPGKQKKLTPEMELMMKIMRPVEPGPPHTPEERVRLRNLMIRYGKLKRRQHNDFSKRVETARRAMWVAIDAMPHKRRVETLNAESTEPPRPIPVFTHTPPIEGFDIGNLRKDK